MNEVAKNAGAALSFCTKLAMLVSTLELGECFFCDMSPSVLVPFRRDSTLDNLDMNADSPIRRMSGRKMGNEAHTMLIPACIVVHTSVLEYDGTRLPFLYPRTTLTRPVMIVLFTMLADVASFTDWEGGLQSAQSEDT
jgi:hypothetical protein